MHITQDATALAIVLLTVILLAIVGIAVVACLVVGMDKLLGRKK